MKTHPHSRPTTRPLRGSAAAQRRQHGAFLITFALFMLFLLGFMGIALDFGRLFVVKTELQTAADSCALAAARELNLQPGAVARAISAGNTVGGRNGVQFQSGSANQISIGFSETLVLPGGYSAALADNKAKYAECSYALTGLKPWLLQAMAAFSGNSAYASNLAVAARAVATRAPSQSTCPIPVAMPLSKYKTLAPGDWVTLLSKANGGSDFGWANLDGTQSSPETRTEMDGYCTQIGDLSKIKLITHGVAATVVPIWNYRFGIYKGDTSDVNHPDYTGYIYNNTTWTLGRNAYLGTSGSTPNFLAQRQAFTPCGTSPSNCGMQGGGFDTVITSAKHKAYGTDRRIVVVPVVDDTTRLLVPSPNPSFICMLMLQPMKIPVGDVQLEYLGNANAPNSPCTSVGLAGGMAGPLVPVLVR